MDFGGICHIHIPLKIDIVLGVSKVSPVLSFFY